MAFLSKASNMQPTNATRLTRSARCHGKGVQKEEVIGLAEELAADYTAITSDYLLPCGFVGHCL